MAFASDKARQGAAGAGGAGYTIDQSLRLNAVDSAYLSRTPSSSSNRKTWTWSGWVKLSSIGDAQLFTARQSSDGSSRGGIFIDGNYKIFLYEVTSGSIDVLHTSVPILRDTSAWYHIVVAFDTTQATTNDRTKIYINGSEVDLTRTYSPSQNYDGYINYSSATHYIGWNYSTQYTHGYISEVNFIDGQALDPTSFGETGDYGEWKPIAYTGTYGTNGFYLDFDGTYYNDKSGNGNNWTANNLATTDVVLDTPTNNFPTMNPLLDTGTTATHSEGNLKVAMTAGDNTSGAASTIPMISGKWYVEGYIVSEGNNTIIGVVDADEAAGKTMTYGINASFAHTDSYRTRASYRDRADYGGTYAHITDYGGTMDTDDIAMLAIDMDNRKLYIGANGYWADGSAGYTSSSPDAYIDLGNTGLQAWIDTGIVYIGNANAITGSTWVMNFGQDSSFAGTTTAQGNSDGNSIGDFYYTPPTGFLALCTSNLSDPAVVPSENFNAVTYTGAGTPTSVTGVGFQPDLGIFASRAGDNHPVYDVQRGTNRLYTNTNNAQGSGSFTSWDSDGFTVSADGEIGDNGVSYVSWLWKADNTTGSSNSDGTITSTVSANPDAGFSIVSYTGNGVDLAEVGHGLSQAPEMYIVKNLDQLDNWKVGAAPHIDRAYSLHLNDTSAASSEDSWGNKTPTASVVKLGQDVATNTSGEDYIMYCFHNVEGFSKVGTYTGNADTGSDQPFIYLGFRPKFWMHKRYDSAGDGWWIYDADRNTYNPIDKLLYADRTNAEATQSGSAIPMDFLSNGVKIRNTSTDGSINGSGNTYLYIAFAEHPFKYTNAR